MFLGLLGKELDGECPDMHVLEVDAGLLLVDPDLLWFKGVILFADIGVFGSGLLFGVPERLVAVARKSLLLP